MSRLEQIKQRVAGLEPAQKIRIVTEEVSRAIDTNDLAEARELNMFAVELIREQETWPERR